MSEIKRVVIIGGGFGGIAAALALYKKRAEHLKITLISDKTHFEYTPALYHVVTGRSPLEVCIPLREIFEGKSVEILRDRIGAVDLLKKSAEGESGACYNFDFLILAPGSETSYFNIPGLKELSFGFKSITEALRLKQHIHKVFSEAKAENAGNKASKTHIVIVGGGSSGVELAGELARYAREHAKIHGIDPSFITIDVIEASPRLLLSMAENVSKRIYKRLHDLGVNIFLNRPVLGEEMKKIRLKDMELMTDTVIWTAGVNPHHLYAEIKGLELDKKGRVVVDDYLQAKGTENIFVIGDGAQTPYSGMAQTAVGDGKFVAEVIFRKNSGGKIPRYLPKKPAHAVPVGRGFAAVTVGPFTFYGRIGWWLRRAADLRYFLSILPFFKALSAFRNGRTFCETCDICLPNA